MPGGGARAWAAAPALPETSPLAAAAGTATTALPRRRLLAVGQLKHGVPGGAEGTRTCRHTPKPPAAGRPRLPAVVIPPASRAPVPQLSYKRLLGQRGISGETPAPAFVQKFGGHVNFAQRYALCHVYLLGNDDSSFNGIFASAEKKRLHWPCKSAFFSKVQAR